MTHTIDIDWLWAECDRMFSNFARSTETLAKHTAQSHNCSGRCGYCGRCDFIRNENIRSDSNAVWSGFFGKLKYFHAQTTSIECLTHGARHRSCRQTDGESKTNFVKIEGKKEKWQTAHHTTALHLVQFWTLSRRWQNYQSHAQCRTCSCVNYFLHELL